MTAAPLTVRKLHGAGNDFLVLVDHHGQQALDPDLARALCDRRSGLGADGVMLALAPRDGGDVRMELRNADGSAAETSGNGLRCLALAALDAGLVTGPSVRVETAAGMREVEVRSTSRAGADLAVDMGPVSLGEVVDDVPAEGWRGRRADVGNPHLVLLAPSLDGVAIAALGPLIERSEPGGINVEVVTPPGGMAGTADGWGDCIDLLVWERGAGVTLACGSGSCAAAAAAREWGLCGDRVTVRNPGGDLHVELSRADRLPVTAVLSGPTTRVATMVVTLEAPEFDARREDPVAR